MRLGPSYRREAYWATTHRSQPTDLAGSAPRPAGVRRALFPRSLGPPSHTELTPPGGRVHQVRAALRPWYETDFRSERTALGRALRAYVDGLRLHLAEAVRVVAPGGIVAYVVANTIRSGRVFDLVGGFQDLLIEAGFSKVRAMARAQEGRRILPAGRDPATGRFAGGSGTAGSAGVREYIVVGQRP